MTSGLAASPAFAAQGFPREVTDALGRRVRIAAPPQRIVVVFPSNVELAWALGLEDRVAAIGGRVRWPESARAKPSIGGSLGYSAEAVAAYRPDLLVVTPSHYTALGLVEAFERVQVPSVVLAHPDLPSVLRNIDLLGRATGADDAARALRASMEERLNAVARTVAVAPRRSVYLETAAAARGAFQTMGTGHYANDALQWAGGRNVFADLQGSQQVSAEAIFVRDPDVIISLQQVPKDPASIAERPGWHSLRAVKSGRVVVLERSHKLIPGPRQIEAVEQYARALHPELFA
ncbi:ABC transporter substrate-binding protein [Variovorax sp. OK605]|uniref:ABC transporter substrate-binding protein n=1 Tax=Variovorax sp. OK605 TaxID=1855317 RepID=UPI00210A0F8E|nr:ABC transporter substrate-binding protein [Variovorax sp. OK605]